MVTLIQYTVMFDHSYGIAHVLPLIFLLFTHLPHKYNIENDTSKKAEESNGTANVYDGVEL